MLNYFVKLTQLGDLYAHVPQTITKDVLFLPFVRKSILFCFFSW